ncbi:flagellar biosynthesis anti-sigma factor FlgM [Polynucleobacter corsicus]|uniref:flagellar biosynthesis anti-sigma factor FlgM n=1 Tax=Polynucleobacter corsicus TaxID=2081042 RepID=UPI001BFDB40E|nr:hypothetical protein [Polynucleobacter corsicus]QWE19298.1 hypothetical protein C2747_03470 [Polynucleobacter corsicus]
MKINENRSALPGQTEAKKSTQGGSASAPDSTSSAKTPNAGVNLDLNPAVTAASTVSISSARSISDADALEKIRKLIEQGEFKVDFPKTAELILREAVAAAGNSSKF